jgi:hypothetical protein
MFIAVQVNKCCFENYTKPISTLCGKNVDFISSKAFAATGVNESFLGYQPCQVIKNQSDF